MDNLGDWIYIIGIIIAIVSSISSGKKKKEQAKREAKQKKAEKRTLQTTTFPSIPQPTTTQQEPISSWKDLLEALTEEKEEIIEPLENSVTKKEKKDPEPFLDSSKEGSYIDTKKTSIKIDKKNTKNKRTNSIYVNSLFKDHSDLKKAIIYNEIFSKKY